MLMEEKVYILRVLNMMHHIHITGSIRFFVFCFDALSTGKSGILKSCITAVLDLSIPLYSIVFVS